MVSGYLHSHTSPTKTLKDINQPVVFMKNKFP